VARYRDVQAFHERAPGYERGWRGQMHHRIVERTMQLALAAEPAPGCVLDVGSGTGLLLRELAGRLPSTACLTGIDPAPGMIAVAQALPGADGRLRYLRGAAEDLPFPDGTFDLLVSTTSFDHWRDQRKGLAECSRVLRADGHLVLADQFSDWLLPTVMWGSRRGRARTERRASRLLREVGFRSLSWHDVYAVIIRAVVAQR
jgi:ubiquinone/menaquinone biosynthesis C-methylase UbiE